MSAMKDSTLASGWGDYAVSSPVPVTRLNVTPSAGVYQSLLGRLQEASKKVAEISRKEAEAEEKPQAPGK